MRESLRLRVQTLRDQSERLGWLAQFVPKLAGSGLIYTLTVYDAKRVAEWLRHRGWMRLPITPICPRKTASTLSRG